MNKNKSVKVTALLLALIVLALTAYQVTKRLRWDFGTKQYSVAVRYEDIERASPIFGETELGLTEKLVRTGAEIVLFRENIGSEGGFAPPELVSELKNTNATRGLEVTNLQLAKEKDYRELLDYMKKLEPEFVVLRGLSSPNIPDFIGNWLGENDLVLGAVEFRNQETVRRLAKEEDLQVVRLHRVFDKEVGTLTPVEKKARYERAVQERNIGIIEYRITTNSDLAEQLDILSSIQENLSATGYEIGELETVRGANGDGRTRAFVAALLLSGSLGLFLAILIPETYLSAGRLIVLTVLSFVGFMIGSLVLPILTVQAGALILAVSAPLVVYKLVLQYGKSFREDPGIIDPFLDLILLSFFSTLVGLIISSVMLDEVFLLKLQQFRGVKVSLFFPLLIMVIAAFYRGSFRPSEIKFDYKKALLGTLLLGLFLFLLFRSGNFTFLRSTELEEAIRRWLENVLFVRPRFKEFVLGHPSLIAWLYIAGRYRKKFQLCKLALFLVGFIGQISIINTFAHIHTPVTVSLIRTANGLAGGLILGAILLLLIVGGEYLWKLQKG
ncbi:DUF5693 family protein [Candidatus Bipolaricaulota bacterium]|nr:DUF5693 family protein [Candidatus Bipolaricaulota bacterium]